MTRNSAMSVFAAAAAATMSMIAECAAYEPLSPDRGHTLVKNAFRNAPFWTGAWSNDVSCLLPFQWSVPGKGTFTFFSAAEHKFYDGRAWEMDEIGAGRLLYCKHECSCAVNIWFMPEHLFEVEYSDGRKCLCYHNERMRGGDAETDGVGFVENLTWSELDVGTNGCPQKTIRNGWPEALFADGAFKSARSVVPFRFRGQKAEVVKEKDAIRKRLDENASTQNGWRMDATQRGALAAKHCRYASHNADAITIVHVIACDVNHDGMCDAYVTSDVESVDGGKHKWALYLGTASGFSRHLETIKVSEKQTEDLYFETDVTAAKDAFFRIDRVEMPAYVIVLSELDGHPESWSYVHHESPVKVFRSQKGFAGADFYSCLGCGKSGVSSIRDMFLSYYTLVNVERLPCESVVVSKSQPNKPSSLGE